MKPENTKTVTIDLLKDLRACSSRIEYWQALPEDNRSDPLWLMQHAIDSDDEGILKDANWLIASLLSTKNARRYAVFAARQSLPLFESEDRPREEIEAAEAVIKSNRDRARLVARDAWAARAAWVDDAVSWAAATSAAAWADAVTETAADAGVDSKQMRIEILKYGMELLK